MSNSTATNLWRHQKRRRNLTPTDSSELGCAICGEKACGYNFDVLSCASCKVFFRRNAFHRSLQCQSGTSSCNVFGVNNRKTCKYCRLQRCLEMGMRTEFITPMEKLVRRSNYAGRHEREPKIVTNEHPSSAATSVKSEETFKSDIFEMSSINSSHSCVLGTQLPLSVQTTLSSPNSYATTQEGNSQFEKFPSLFTIDVGDLELLFNQEYPQDTSENGIHTFSHSLPPTIHESYSTNNFSEELKPLFYQPLFQSDEMYMDATFEDYSRILQDMATRVRCPFTGSEVAQYRQIAKNVESCYNNHEIILRRLIIGLKRVPQFMCLSRRAQIHLLKQSIHGILIIFVSLVYETETRTFNIPYQNNEFIETYKIDFEARFRKVTESLSPCNKNVSYCVNLKLDSHSSIPLCCLYHSASTFITQLRFKFGLCRFRDHTNTNSALFSVSSSYQTTQEMMEDPEKDYVIKFFSVFHHVMIRMQTYTEQDPTLVFALCLLRLFQQKPNDLITNHQEGIYSTTDRYFIERVQSELSWYIQRYVKQQWHIKTTSPTIADKNGTNFCRATTRTFADALLEEKLHNLWSIFEIVRPMEDFHTLQHQFLRQNLLTPLLQEITTLPISSTLSSNPKCTSNSY